MDDHRTPLSSKDLLADITKVSSYKDPSQSKEPEETSHTSSIRGSRTPVTPAPETHKTCSALVRNTPPAEFPSTSGEFSLPSLKKSTEPQEPVKVPILSDSTPIQPAPVEEEPVQPPRTKRRPPRKGKRTAFQVIFCVLRRTVLTVLVVALLLVAGAYLALNLMFNGPSPAARDVLTMSLSEASGTKWLPGLFMDDALVEQIRQGDAALFVDDEDPANLAPIEINTDSSLTANSDEWKDYPDGIRIEPVSGDTYNAYVMLVRDPASVYLATSTEHFSMDIPGTRITNQIETEGAIAAVNAGAFFDNGTSDPSVGSVPQGLVVSGGKVVWNSGKAPEEGFVGFNQDNVLVVADTMTADKAMELGIRDGCCFGPVLIQNGAIKNEVYNSSSGYNPRTAIGQRTDGSVILLCIDGRQAGSLGATYADIINIMVEYGAVNACNLDGGSSTIMLYRDQYGRYGEPGQVQMINNYSLLQEQPRKMPTFIMVRPSGEE
jgi:exopolysaccharide biosynthesis protein